MSPSQPLHVPQVSLWHAAWPWIPQEISLSQPPHAPQVPISIRSTQDVSPSQPLCHPQVSLWGHSMALSPPRSIFIEALLCPHGLRSPLEHVPIESPPCPPGPHNPRSPTCIHGAASPCFLGSPPPDVSPSQTLHVHWGLMALSMGHPTLLHGTPNPYPWGTQPTSMEQPNLVHGAPNPYPWGTQPMTTEGPTADLGASNPRVPPPTSTPGPQAPQVPPRRPAPRSGGSRGPAGRRDGRWPRSPTPAGWWGTAREERS